MTNEEIAVTLTEHGQHIKSNMRRINELEEAQKEMRDLVRSVDKLAQSMQTMANEQERQGKQIDSLETSKNDTFKFWLRTILAAVATKKDHFQEFSKLILFLFAVNYFVGGAFLLWVVQYQLTHAAAPEYVSAAEFVTYFTAPIVAGLLSYFGKAAVENFEKIKNNFTGKSTEKSDSNKVAKG